MAIIKTEAIVLKRYDLRETSLLVNFYTLDQGKITGEMKGIRDDPKKFASATDTMVYKDTVLLLIWTARPPVAVMIKNAQNAKSYRNQFELMWKTAKR